MTDNMNGWTVAIDVQGTLDTMHPIKTNVKAFLEKLQQNGFNVVLATGDNRADYAKKILENAGIEPAHHPAIYFDLKKSEPDKLRRFFTKKLAQDLNRIILIDDTDKNVIAAQFIGVKAIHFISDFWDEPTDTHDFITNLGTPDVRKHHGTVDDIFDVIVSMTRSGNQPAAKQGPTPAPAG